MRARIRRTVVPAAAIVGSFCAALLCHVGLAGAAALPCVLGRCVPVLSTPIVSITGQTTAAFSGTVDPEGLPTQYAFSDSLARGGQVSTQAAQSLAASDVTSGVSWAASGLIPGETYVVTLSAQNTNGSAAGAQVSFTMPLAPATPIALKLSHGENVATGVDPGIVARLGGSDPATGVLLLAASSAAGPLATVSAGTTFNAGELLSPGTNISWSIGPGALNAPDVINLFTQNRFLALRSTGTGSWGDIFTPTRAASTSEVLPVYVFPAATLRLTTAARARTGSRVRAGAPAVERFRVQISFAGTHGLLAADPPPAVLYRRAVRGWQRLASAPYSASHGDWSLSGEQAGLSGTGAYLVCLSEPLSARLGRPFSFPACGSASLSGARGPVGSEYRFGTADSPDAVAPVGVYDY